MYADIHRYIIRTLDDDGQLDLSKSRDGMVGSYHYTSQTVTSTRAPSVLEKAASKSLNQGSKTAIKFERVRLLKKEDYLLVQTDKGQYKAEDTVKFRILALDQDLRYIN